MSPSWGSNYGDETTVCLGNLDFAHSPWLLRHTSTGRNFVQGAGLYHAKDPFTHDGSIMFGFNYHKEGIIYVDETMLDKTHVVVNHSDCYHRVDLTKREAPGVTRL